MPTKADEKSIEKKAEKPATQASLSGENIATAGFAIAIASIFTNFFTLGVMAIVGLTLSLIGRVQTKRAGRPSSMALAGIIISSVVMVLSFIAFIFFLMLVVIGGSRHQIDCDSPRYVENGVCDYKDDDLSAPQQQDVFRRLDPGTL